MPLSAVNDCSTSSIISIFGSAKADNLTLRSLIRQSVKLYEYFSHLWGVGGILKLAAFEHCPGHLLIKLLSNH